MTELEIRMFKQIEELRAEIARLTEKLDRWQAFQAESDAQHAADEKHIEEQRQEIARLREAIEDWVHWDQNGCEKEAAARKSLYEIAREGE